MVGGTIAADAEGLIRLRANAGDVDSGRHEGACIQIRGACIQIRGACIQIRGACIQKAPIPCPPSRRSHANALSEASQPPGSARNLGDVETHVAEARHARHLGRAPARAPSSRPRQRAAPRQRAGPPPAHRRHPPSSPRSRARRSRRQPDSPSTRCARHRRRGRVAVMVTSSMAASPDAREVTAASKPHPPRARRARDLADDTSTPSSTGPARLLFAFPTRRVVVPMPPRRWSIATRRLDHVPRPLLTARLRARDLPDGLPSTAAPRSRPRRSELAPRRVDEPVTSSRVSTPIGELATSPEPRAHPDRRGRHLTEEASTTALRGRDLLAAVPHHPRSEVATLPGRVGTPMAVAPMPSRTTSGAPRTPRIDHGVFPPPSTCAFFHRRCRSGQTSRVVGSKDGDVLRKRRRKPP